MEAMIRPIEAKDNAAVAKIIRQVMTEFSCVGDGYSIEDPEVDNMSTAYAEANAAFFVIEHAGTIQGCGGFGSLVGGEPGICELKKMYFLPSLRGMGMGRRLLDHCIAAAQTAGYQKMYLETVDRMTAANQLYQKTGFVPLNCALGATGHGGCDAFYVLELSEK